MKRLYISLCTVICLMILVVPGVQADNSGHKFIRGLAGMTCGVLELPGNIVKQTNTNGAVGIPVGIATGLGMIVARELIGVYEFVTAPFPIPAGYQQILTPEYPWGYFK